MAAVMSLANQQLCAEIISTYLFLCMKCSCRIKTKISHEIKQKEQTIIFFAIFFFLSQLENWNKLALFSNYFRPLEEAPIPSESTD